MASEKRGAKKDDDAFQVIKSVLKEYGIGQMANTVWMYLQEGFSQDRIWIELQETDAWRKRFSGNEKRRQAGIPVLSPAEYLATESAYRQVMEQAGMPPGFYDQPSDFADWIAKDVSPQEIQGRVKVAQQLIESIDPKVRNEFEKFYTRGDMVAYALDRKRTTETLAQQLEAARASASAINQGMSGLDRRRAETIGGLGLTQDGLNQGFSQAAQTADRAARLGGVYGSQTDANTATDAVFLSDAEAQEELAALGRRESGAFSGSGGLAQTALRASN